MFPQLFRPVPEEDGLYSPLKPDYITKWIQLKEPLMLLNRDLNGTVYWMDIVRYYKSKSKNIMQFRGRLHYTGEECTSNSLLKLFGER